MKKLLLTLLLLFALGSSGAWAQTAAYTCEFNNSGPNNGGYSNSWTNTWDGHEWAMKNFNNNNWGNGWTYVKCGNKTAAYVGSIATSFIVPEVISEVVVTIDKITTASVNSIKLYTSTSAAFEDKNEIPGPELAQGEYKITVPPAYQKANQYYMVEFDCAKGSANGLVQVSKVELFATVESDVPTITASTGSVIYEPEKEYTVAKGTKVKFFITLYDEFKPSVTVNDEPLAESEVMDDGVFELTINELTMVEITAGEVEATYMFDLKDAFTPEGWSWKRVVDPSTFRVGDKLIIASADANVALGNAHTTDATIPSIGVTFETDDDNDVYLQFDEVGKTSEPMVLELAASTENADNNIPWVLKSTNYAATDGYLSATSDKNHELQIVADEDDLSIEITDGDAIIDFNGHTHHILGYNTNLNVFACYDQTAIDDETGQNQYRHADIQVYRLTDDAADLRVRYTATAADGSKYTPWTVTDVAEGTEVTFGVQFYNGDQAATIKVGDGEAQPLAGNNVVTITEDTTVDVTTDVKTVSFIFKVRPTFEVSAGNAVLYYTVKDALEAIASGVTPTINVKGIVKEVTGFSSNYGSITYTIADKATDTEVLTIYNGLGFDREMFESKDDIQVGATVVVSGQIFNYQDKTPEMAQNNALLYYKDNTVSIAASTGTTKYRKGYNVVNNGTEVTFAVENTEEIIATVNGEDVEFENGKYTITITEDTKVDILADALDATYNFVVSLSSTSPKGYEWKLVDDAATLAAGDKLIIACAESGVAVSNKNSAEVTYLFPQDVTVTDGVLTFAAAENDPLVLNLQGNADAWNFVAINSTSLPTGAFISGSSSANQMNLIASTEANISATATTITIDEKGDAKMPWGTRYIQYNASTPRFACYSSKQKAVQLYRLTRKPIELSAVSGEGEDAVVYESGESYEVEVGTEVVFTAANLLDEVFTVKVNDEEAVTVEGNSYKVTIEAETTVALTVGEGEDQLTATYTFTVPAPEPVLPTLHEGSIVASVKHSAKLNTVTVEYQYGVVNHDEDNMPFVTVEIRDANGNIEGLTELEHTHGAMTLAKAPVWREGEQQEEEATEPENVTAFKGKAVLAGGENVTLAEKEGLHARLLLNIGDQQHEHITDPANTATGIEDVTVDANGEAVYYNLQGIRVNEPAAGQLYIKSEGGKTSKVRF